MEEGDIIKRCEEMKVDRIVGMGSMSLAEILQARKDKYESVYDIRILAEKGASVEKIANQVLPVKRHVSN